MVREDVEFLSEGVILRGWFYPAADARPDQAGAAIVMAQ